MSMNTPPAGVARGSSGFGIASQGAFMIGSAMITSMFDAWGGHEPRHLEGPQPFNLTTQGGGWGSTIPQLYGTAKFAGTSIWIGEIISAAPLLTCSFAIGLCRGPITNILRIWCNDVVIFDGRSTPKDLTPEGAAVAARTVWRFYVGDANHMPDSKMVLDSHSLTFDTVISTIRNNQPDDGNNLGDMYAIAHPAKDQWSRHGGDITEYTTFQNGGSGWAFNRNPYRPAGPKQGDLVKSLHDGHMWVFDGWAWGPFNDTAPFEAASPAYRDLAFVVFEDFPLDLTGNSIPNFVFEVQKTPDVEVPWEAIDEQTTTGAIFPDAEDEALECTVLSMTSFAAGLGESATYSPTAVVIEDNILKICPDGSESRWIVPAPLGVQENCWANICVKVVTAPNGRASIASSGTVTSLFHLILREDLFLEVVYSGVAGSDRATSVAPLVLGKWHRISFVVQKAGSTPAGYIYVDGVEGSHDGTPVTLSGLAVFVLGTAVYASDYEVHFKSAALTGGGPLPLGGWEISRVPVVGTATGYAVVAHSASTPYVTDGSTDQETMLAIINKTGGWPAIYSNPATRNSSTTEDAGLSVWAGGAEGGSYETSPTPLLDAFPQFSEVRFYAIQAAVTCCYVVGSHDMTVTVTNTPDSTDSTSGAIAVVTSYRGSSIRACSSAAGPGYWTSAEFEAMLITFGSTTHNTLTNQLTCYVLHSGFVPPQTVDPGTSVDMDPSGNTGDSLGGGGSNMVAAWDEGFVVFMESGYWYAYGVMHGLVYAWGEFLEDLDSNGDPEPVIPATGCDFDMDENDVIYTAKWNGTDCDIVRIGIDSADFVELSDSGFATWNLDMPTRIRVARKANGPVCVMCANSVSGVPGELIRIRSREDFLWGGYTETMVGASDGMLFRCMTVDDVLGWLFAVCSDGSGGCELVFCVLSEGALLDAARVDISDYITDPEVIMVWSSGDYDAESDRIAIGQRGANERIAFFTWELGSGAGIVLTFGGMLSGAVVPAQATAAWRKGIPTVGGRSLTFAYDNGGPTLVKTISLSGMAVTNTYSVADGSGDILPLFAGGSLYIVRTNSVISGIAFEPDHLTFSYVVVNLTSDLDPVALLSSIVANLCEQAGLSAAQYDVSALSDNVHGYLLENRMAVRAALAPLSDIYSFDGIATGGKIVFRKRTGVSVETIAAGNLAAHEEGSSRPQDILLVRVPDEELPQAVEVGYISVETDYLMGLSRQRRGVAVSQNLEAIALPMVIKKSEVEAYARKKLVSAWMERDRFTFSVSRKYVYLEPGDVISVPTQEGTIDLRIESMEMNGMIINVEAVPDSPITWE